MDTPNNPAEWDALASREAAAILNAPGVNATGLTYKLLVEFVALGWLKGAIYATHLDLYGMDRAEQRLQEDLR